MLKQVKAMIVYKGLPEMNQKIRELENWGRQIDLYVKRLRQVESHLDLRASQTRAVPRHLRFRERQSIGDRRDALHQALSLALEADIVTPAPPDVMTKSAHAEQRFTVSAMSSTSSGIITTRRSRTPMARNFNAA